MNNYKITVESKPVFDDQLRIKVSKLIPGESSKDDKEEFVMSGLDTKENIKKEVEYWLNK